MNTIYVPNGKAAEYSPWALNLYTSCDHGCSYCYVNNIPGFRGRNTVNTTVKPRDGILEALESYLLKNGAPKEQILLCFTCDPFPIAETEYEITRRALALLNHYRARVAILTKGGLRALGALQEIREFGDRVKIGATLTFMNQDLSRQNEPGSAAPADRLKMLESFHALGIKTWVSIEPVIDPKESIECILKSLDFTDHYKVGKLNHAESKTDWADFLSRAVNTLRTADKSFYIKRELQKYEKEAEIVLTEKEKNSRELFLR